MAVVGTKRNPFRYTIFIPGAFEDSSAACRSSFSNGRMGVGSGGVTNMGVAENRQNGGKPRPTDTPTVQSAIAAPPPGYARIGRA